MRTQDDWRENLVLEPGEKPVLDFCATLIVQDQKNVQFDLAGFSGFLEKIFPRLTRADFERGLITVMDRIVVGPEGVVEGRGAVAQRVTRAYEEFAQQTGFQRPKTREQQGIFVSTNRRVILLMKGKSASTVGWELAFDTPLEGIVTVTPTSRSREYVEETKKGLFGKESVRKIVHEYGFVISCKNPDGAISKYEFATGNDVSMLLKTLRETAQHRKSEAMSEKRVEVVQYQIATSFEFGKDGAVTIRCPHCGASKPQTEQASEVRCPSCKQTYTIPKRILDML